MKKANTLLVLAIILSCQLSYAQSQVKRQFQDETFAETTVVIKDDAATNDLEVLNNYFDMDDVSIGQIIRITTETTPVSKPTPPVAIQETPVAPKAVVVKAPAEQAEKPEVVQVVQKQVEEKEEVAGAAAQPQQKSIRSGGSSTRSVKKRAYIGNKRNKRVKAPKRKNKKRRNSSKCYSF